MNRPEGSASAAERDLQGLIARLSPQLSDERFTFDSPASPEMPPGTFALIREAEGVTAIREADNGAWARISLGVASSLDAVGLTAVISRRLADEGISANVVAGAHHDHFFVPWDRRHEALKLLS